MGGEVDPIEWKHVQKSQWDLGPGLQNPAGLRTDIVKILVADTGQQWLLHG